MTTTISSPKVSSTTLGNFLDMISENGVKLYCSEDASNIENYDLAIADPTRTWDCHHRLEIQDGIDYSIDELKETGMYLNRPANELIFLPHDEHISLHKRGRKASDETRRKMSEALKGKPMSEENKRRMSEARRGKKRKPMSEETKRKISEAKKNLSSETRMKMSKARIGKPKNEEWKMKISEAIKSYWAKRKNADAVSNVENGI